MEHETAKANGLEPYHYLKYLITALEDGYTQAKITKHLGVSRSLVCKIVKGRGVYSTTDP